MLASIDQLDGIIHDVKQALPLPRRGAQLAAEFAQLPGLFSAPEDVALAREWSAALCDVVEGLVRLGKGTDGHELVTGQIRAGVEQLVAEEEVLPS
jgi:hypothetical protein